MILNHKYQNLGDFKAHYAIFIASVQCSGLAIGDLIPWRFV